jgi:hypothetical protein
LPNERSIAAVIAHLRAQLIDDDLEALVARDGLDEREDLLDRLPLQRIEAHFGSDAHVKHL